MIALERPISMLGWHTKCDSCIEALLQYLMQWDSLLIKSIHFLKAHTYNKGFILGDILGQ